VAGRLGSDRDTRTQRDPSVAARQRGGGPYADLQQADIACSRYIGVTKFRLERARS